MGTLPKQQRYWVALKGAIRNRLEYLKKWAFKTDALHTFSNIALVIKIFLLSLGKREKTTESIFNVSMQKVTVRCVVHLDADNRKVLRILQKVARLPSSVARAYLSYLIFLHRMGEGAANEGSMQVRVIGIWSLTST